MNIKAGAHWFEPTQEAPIMIVLTAKDKENIANMVSDATMYAVFADDCGMSSEDRLAWMTQPDPTPTPEGRHSLLASHPIPMHQADTPGVDEAPRRVCDCERSLNGMGIAGRECDCPTVEDGWTEEQHQAAISYLSPPSLASRVALLGQGACDCNTKSPDVHMHLPTCRYRQAMELADAVEELET